MAGDQVARARAISPVATALPRQPAPSRSRRSPESRSWSAPAAAWYGVRPVQRPGLDRHGRSDGRHLACRRERPAPDRRMNAGRTTSTVPRERRAWSSRRVRPRARRLRDVRGSPFAGLLYRGRRRPRRLGGRFLDRAACLGTGSGGPSRLSLDRSAFVRRRPIESPPVDRNDLGRRDARTTSRCYVVGRRTRDLPFGSNNAAGLRQPATPLGPRRDDGANPRPPRPAVDNVNDRLCPRGVVLSASPDLPGRRFAGALGEDRGDVERAEDRDDLGNFTPRFYCAGDRVVTRT
jgi:hypothetical protein